MRAAHRNPRRPRVAAIGPDPSTGWIAALALSAATTLTAMPARGQCMYEVIPIPIEDCSTGIPFTPRWIANGIGVVDGEIVVVGEVEQCIDEPGIMDQPFWWTLEEGDHRIELPFPEGEGDGAANDINSSGELVGWLEAGGFGRRPFIHVDGVSEVLPMPDGAYIGEAFAINDDSIIVGYAERELPLEGYTPCWWDADRQFHAIEVEGYSRGCAYGVNNQGQIVGFASNGSESENSRAFVFVNGVMTMIEPVAPAIASQAFYCNDRGRVAGGMYEPPTKRGIRPLRPFIYQGGVVSGLDPPATYQWAAVRGIDAGVVTLGYCRFGSGPSEVVIWHDEELFDLERLLVDSSAGYSLGSPKAMLASGEIIAEIYGDPRFDGTHGLLIPVDRPDADVSGDCRVDLVDIELLLDDWQYGRVLNTDLNRDGRVDVLDLLAMLRSMS